MKTLTEMLDELVKAVKQKEDFLNVRFVHSGKMRSAEKPVTGFIIACGVGSVQITEEDSENPQRTAELNFHIYAPCSTGARELSALSHLFMEALYEADTQGRLTSLSLSDAVYDSDLTTLRRTVVAKITLRSAEKAIRDKNILINGQKYVNAQSFEVTAKANEYIARELLAGDTDRRLEFENSYVIKMSISSDTDPFEGLSDFSLSIGSGESKKTYLGCRVTECTEKHGQSEETIREYTLKAQSVS